MLVERRSKMLFQVLLNLPSCRILACAPSNSAADLIVHRLLQGRVVKSQVYRMCALSRLYSTVPDNIKVRTDTLRGCY